ncbi:MAG: DUF6438 domain-containing protein [Bacteroidota bacterium]
MRSVFFLVCTLCLVLGFSSCNRKASKIGQELPERRVTSTQPEGKDIQKDSIGLYTTRQKLDTAVEVKKPVYLLASIRREACFGRCPSFEARLYSDGRAVYDGLSNVEKIGQFDAQAQRSDITDLFDEAIEMGFFQLSQRYPENGTFIADLPSTYTSLHFKGALYKVVNNHDSPLTLRRFEKRLEAFFNGLEWRSIDTLRQ